MPVVMKGKEVADELKKKIVDDVSFLKEKDINPVLATVRVGEDPGSMSYEKGTNKFMASLGIECRNFVYPEDISKEDFFEKFKAINADREIPGILLFRPLPKGFEGDALEALVNPEKDVDGSCFINMGKVSAGHKNAFEPCTAKAVMKILEHYNIALEGKEAVVIGRSAVIGRPVSLMLTGKNATVTVCHSRTKNIEGVCKRADVLVAALGKMHFVTEDFVKDGAIVIDVGINVDENGKLQGDVDYDGIFEKTSYITPVPGGVGNVTNAVLAENVIRAAKILNNIN